MHGYELIELLPEIAGSETHVDVGNLYRVLRALEEEDRWADALRDAQGVLSGFLERYEQGEGR